MHSFYLLTVSLFFACTALATAELPSGCLIVQKHSSASLELHGGTIDQSFVPCQNGKLEYLLYYLKSADHESFSVPMSIQQNGRTISRQLIVIPGNNQPHDVRAWIARDINLSADKEYSVHIDIPHDRKVIVAFSESNLYDSGSLKINEKAANGDLTFEIGIRKQADLFDAPNRTTCPLGQTTANGLLKFNDQLTQTFTPSQSVTLSELVLQYQSEVSGDLRVTLKIGKAVIQSYVAHLLASEETMPILIQFDNPAALNPGVEYELCIEKLGAWPAELPRMAVGKNDPYPCGKLLLNNTDTSMDLSFEVIETEVTPTAQLTVDNFPEHDCVVAQHHIGDTYLLSGDRMVQELQFCSDGMIEGIYFNGALTGTAGSVEVAITNTKGSLIAVGTLYELPGRENALAVRFEPFQVVSAQTYWLEVLVPSTSSLTLFGSTDSKHLITGTMVNDEPVDFAPAQAVGMKTFSFDFVSATEEELAISCYPNPFVTDFTVSIPPFSGTPGRILVFDVMGNQVFEGTVAPSDLPQKMIVVPQVALRNGFHTVRFEHNNHVTLQTIIKQ